MKMENIMKNIYFVSINVLSAKITQILQKKLNIQKVIYTLTLHNLWRYEKNSKTLSFLSKMIKYHKKIFFISINVLSAKITQISQNKNQYSKSYSQYIVPS